MKHLIKIETTEHGALSVHHMGKDQQWCEAGLSVKVNNQPDAGWGLQKLYYVVAGSSEKHPIDIVTRTFIMPNGNVTIGGVFKRFVIGDWTEGKQPNVGKPFVVGPDGEPRSIPIEEFIGTITDTELDNDSERPVQNKVVTDALLRKQDTLESGATIKTLNGESLLGSGDIVITQRFKGWFSDTTELNDAYPSPAVGDYAYVMGATSSDPVDIYSCTTAGTWSDSGNDVDTSTTQTFHSGQEVQDVSIIDNLNTNSADDVLSAKMGMTLQGYINGVGDYQTMTLTLEDNAYYTYVSGQNKIKSTTTARSGCKCCVLPCREGEKYNVFGRGSATIKLYAFTKSDYTVLDGNSSTVNTRGTGLEITAPTGAEMLFINFDYYSADDDKLQKMVYSELGLEQRVFELEYNLPQLQYAGKKVLVFGDSITEFRDNRNKRWTDYAARMMNCEIVNCAIGGSYMSDRRKTELFDPTHQYHVGDFVFYKPSTTMNIYVCTADHLGAWDSSDFEDKSNDDTIMASAAYDPIFVYRMVKAFCNTSVADPEVRFKDQIAAAECIYTWKSTHDDNRAIIQSLVDLDPNTVNMVVIAEGTNDYGPWGYWGTHGSTDTTTLLGAINESVRLLNSTFAFPVFYVTPPVRWYDYTGGSGVAEKFSDNYDNGGTAPRTFKSYVYDVLIPEYESLHVPIIDLYDGLQWNMWNFSNFFNADDGTHPRKGFKNIGMKVASFLLSNRVIL